MKKTTLEKIWNDYHDGKYYTLIGQYAYSVEFHPMIGKCMVIRAKRYNIGDFEKYYIGDWEFTDILA